MRAILTYHSLDDSGSPVSVAPRVFESQVAWLAAGTVRVFPLDDLMVMAAERESPEHAVAITFDDACESVGAVAAPLLAARGLPYTVFTVTGHAGKTNSWGGRSAPGIPELPLMTWDQLGRLRDAGAEIGAHTRTHSRLPSLSAEALDDELSGSADCIAAELGVRPETFAYPYGAHDALVASRARSVFRWSCTTDLRLLGASEDRALLPRLDMYYFRQPGQLESWGTPSFRRRLQMRAGVRRVRELARSMGLAS